jgi:hypothetical protein
MLCSTLAALREENLFFGKKIDPPDSVYRSAKPMDRTYKNFDGGCCLLVQSNGHKGPKPNRIMNWWSRYLEANRQEHVTPHEFANQTGANVTRLKAKRGATE